MLKSTKMKIENQIIANEIAAEKNSILSEKNSILQNHYEKERSTKDRADISLKEYVEMKQKIEELERDLTEAHEVLKKILNPLTECNLSPNLINEIIINHNYEKCEIKLLDSTIDDPLCSKIAVIYRVNKKRLY